MLLHVRTLLGLLWRPVAAMREMHDRAPIGFAVVAAGLAATLYAGVGAVMADYAQSGEWLFSAADGGLTLRLLSSLLYQSLMRAVMTVLFIAVIYVPFAILIANLFERRDGFVMVLREEFAPLAACALAALTIALLVALIPGVVIGWQSAWLSSESVLTYFILLTVLPLPIFAVLMTVAMVSAFNIAWPAATVTTLLSFLSLIGLPLLMQAATFLCASPFLLLILLFLLRDRVDDFLRGQRARQSFKQNLEASTLNPADASAHYHLALLYQQRGDPDAAIKSFNRALEIDPRDTDSHYQLGRIAREQGRPSEALQHFERVIDLDNKHSQNEIWREIGLVYYSAGQFADAQTMFEKFLAVRPSDAQARYWLGMTREQLGQSGAAMQEMRECIESVKTAPAYKYRTERQWLHLAQNFLRERE